MLHLIKGPAGSGKTKYIRDFIARTIQKGDSAPFLMIPEQFTFETERAMLNELGAMSMKKLQVSSFTRLARLALKENSIINNRFINSGMKAVIMSEALENLQEPLTVLSPERLKNKFTSLSPLVDFCQELKSCKISDEALNTKIEKIENKYLKDKLSDLNIIKRAYDEELRNQKLFDDSELLDYLREFALNNRIFEKTTVFFDGFRAFSKQEYELYSIILSQADDVYFTLCTDEDNSESTPFYFMRNFENYLKRAVDKSVEKIDEVFLRQDPNAFPPEIFALEKNLFKIKTRVFCSGNGDLQIIDCADKDEECKIVATQIKKLIRSGAYRCRDIAVIERVNGTYKALLTEELKRLGVPVFEDSRRSLKFEPLFVYLSSVLSLITGKFTTENVLTYLKSGLSGLTVTEISKLEKYSIIWGLSGSMWKNEFKNHPLGFGNEMGESSKKYLEDLNLYREKAILPVLKLKKDCENKTGKEISETIYNFIINQNVKDRLFDLYKDLKYENYPVEAERHATSWNVLMDILDEIAAFGNEKHLTLKRWFEIFGILIDSQEIGEIPQGLDEVTIGSADRIRTEKLKVVFLVGVIKDKFPLVNIKNGVLTDSERAYLNADADVDGFRLRDSFKDSVFEERFICYCAATAAKNKLFLSYHRTDDSGEVLQPSEIIETAICSVNNLQGMYTDLSSNRVRYFNYSFSTDEKGKAPDALKIMSNALDYANEHSDEKTELNALIDFIESDEDAFSLLSRNFKKNSVIRSTLLNYFASKKEYSGRLAALNNVNGSKDYKFNNSDISLKLFNENMYLSASKVEKYYKCPFSYFIRYGMNVEGFKAAEIDAVLSGTVIHFVMEKLFSQFSSEELVKATDSEIKLNVSKSLDDYINEKMGGADNKSKRFMFLYNHFLNTCLAVIDRLKTEFSRGSFIPCGFEVGIGSDIPAYEIELEKDDISQNITRKITLKGSVDRVDMYEKDGIKYIRIIDYKTGKKEFKLSELFEGLNIQMVLYLMALEKNGKAVYGDFIPAGVLYLPSRIGLGDYLNKRSPECEDVEKKRIASGKLSGMVLKSLTVFNAMGVTDNPSLFPVGYNKKSESFTGNTYSQLNFKNLSKVIDEKIENMGNSLHKGFVPAVPAFKNNSINGCDFCDYKSICGFEEGDETRVLNTWDHKESIEMLGGDSDE